MDALSQAFADADRSYMAASKAVGSVPRSLVGNTSTGLGVLSSQLNRAAEQYQHYSGWVYVAVKAIAAKIAGQPVCVGRVGKTPRTGRKLHTPLFARGLDELVEPLPSHPFLAAIQDPNPLQVQWSLLFSTTASLLLTGRSLWWYSKGKEGDQIWPLPSNWCEPADNLRSSWKVRPPGLIGDPFEIPSEEIVLFSLPDPSNPFGMGVSPLQSQAMAVTTDEEIQNAQAAAFRNGIHPTYAIRVGKLPGMLPGQPGDKIVLEPEQRIELISAIKKMYSGTGRTAEPLILDGLIEGVDRISNTAAEMDFLDSGMQTKNRILQAFGVNAVVVGQLEGANKASSFAAAKHFADSTCNPLIELMSQTITRFASSRFAANGEQLLAWIEEVRADDGEEKLAQWKVALASGACTANEYRAAILNLDGMPGGDIVRDALGNPRE